MSFGLLGRKSSRAGSLSKTNCPVVELDDNHAHTYTQYQEVFNGNVGAGYE